MEFFGGPRDGEVWARETPPPGQYWFDRDVPLEGVVRRRSDLYELREETVRDGRTIKPGWYYVTSKKGYFKAEKESPPTP